MIKNFDFCILGAGLAGVSLAHELLKENATVCLVDPNGIASGASGTPLGLVNPATGRHATLTWEAENCYSSILENLTLIQNQSSTQFYKKNGVLRPALDEKIASRMKENFESTQWPTGWIEWLDEKDVKEFHSGISCIGGGIWLPVGITVDISCYLTEFINFLTTKRLITSFGLDYSIMNTKTFWDLQLSNGEKIRSNKLICTTGSSTKEIDLWRNIQIHKVKGQLAVLESSKPLTFDHAVSALGYIASIDSNKFVIGSTYEHKFEHEGIDQQGLNYLMSRFEKVLPNLKKNSKVVSQWSGVRASTPNRMPILGEHSELKNLFTFSGLGSKGLLYSAYLSKQLTNHLIQNTPLHSVVDIQRFQ
tara:strand:+ start:65865 stop:66953 length:1089 start_codon:yes stop_codon:yes gene_type:complete